MGYQNKGFNQQGYAIGTSSFLAIGTAPEDMTLGMLVPNDAFYQRGSKITFVSPGGGNAKYYSEYFGKEVTKTFVYQKAADTEAKKDGWYLDYDVSDEGGYCNMNDLKIPFGEGFMVYLNQGAGETLTYSGEVKTAPTTAGLPNQGYNIIGNCSPVDLFLKDITPNTMFYNKGSKITFVSPGGGNAKYYSEYFGKEVTKTLVYQKADDAEDGEGWYLDYDVSDEGGLCNMNNLIKIDAGEGFFVYKNGQTTDNERIEIPPAIEAPVKE